MPCHNRIYVGFMSSSVIDPIPSTSLVLQSIRAESLDAFNRLRSIHEDSQFVLEVASRYPEYPLVANQRCGAWYADPSKASSEFAYFKSTDGHFGQWTFNLRRANLDLLSILQVSGGIVIVDSTRNGKSMPDALSKTIPLWCAVINEAIRSRDQKTDSFWEIHGKLYTPPTRVSSSEHQQMESLVPGLAQSLLASSFDLPRLENPLRPFWVTVRSSTHGLPPDCLPVICVSASKQVADGIERRATTYTYIQGAADDHESWSMGLTPSMFWANQEEFLTCSRDLTPQLIERVVHSSISGGKERQVRAIDAVNGRISLSSLSSVKQLRGDAMVIQVDKPPHDLTISTALMNPRHLIVYAKDGKTDQAQLLHEILPAVDRFGQDWLRSNQSLVVADVEACYDISIGILMLLLVRHFDDEGHRREEGQSCEVSKVAMRRRLEWIQQSIPRANPSRTTMKRVNEYAISQSRHIHRKLPVAQSQKSQIRD